MEKGEKKERFEGVMMHFRGGNSLKAEEEAHVQHADWVANDSLQGLKRTENAEKTKKKDQSA